MTHVGSSILDRSTVRSLEGLVDFSLLVSSGVSSPLLRCDADPEKREFVYATSKSWYDSATFAWLNFISTSFDLGRVQKVVQEALTRSQGAALPVSWEQPISLAVRSLNEKISHASPRRDIPPLVWRRAVIPPPCSEFSLRPSPAILSGIVSTWNRCYASATLTALWASSRFREILYAAPKNSMSVCLLLTMHAIDTYTIEPLKPTEVPLRPLLASFETSFQQQDASEFLISLLERGCSNTNEILPQIRRSSSNCLPEVGPVMFLSTPPGKIESSIQEFFIGEDGFYLPFPSPFLPLVLRRISEDSLRAPEQLYTPVEPTQNLHVPVADGSVAIYQLKSVIARPGNHASGHYKTYIPKHADDEIIAHHWTVHDTQLSPQAATWRDVCETVLTTGYIFFYDLYRIKD